MSVATYKRGESKAQFLDNLYKLNISVYGLVSKMPKKMQRIYGDKMINTALDAMKIAEVGNGIYLRNTTTQTSYEERIKCFEVVKGYVYSIMSIYNLSIDMMIENCHINKVDSTKLVNNSLRTSKLCIDTMDLITNLIKSDKDRYKNYKNKTD